MFKPTPSIDLTLSKKDASRLLKRYESYLKLLNTKITCCQQYGSRKEPVCIPLLLEALNVISGRKNEFEYFKMTDERGGFSDSRVDTPGKALHDIFMIMPHHGFSLFKHLSETYAGGDAYLFLSLVAFQDDMACLLNQTQQYLIMYKTLKHELALKFEYSCVQEQFLHKLGDYCQFVTSFTDNPRTLYIKGYMEGDQWMIEAPNQNACHKLKSLLRRLPGHCIQSNEEGSTLCLNLPDLFVPKSNMNLPLVIEVLPTLNAHDAELECMMLVNKWPLAKGPGSSFKQSLDFCYPFLEHKFALADINDRYISQQYHIRYGENSSELFYGFKVEAYNCLTEELSQLNDDEERIALIDFALELTVFQIKRETGHDEPIFNDLVAHFSALKSELGSVQGQDRGNCIVM